MGNVEISNWYLVGIAVNFAVKEMVTFSSRSLVALLESDKRDIDPGLSFGSQMVQKKSPGRWNSF